MKYRSLNDLKQDNEISPEDVARFALYENDLNDSGKFTGICDLVVACENSQTNPLKEQIKILEARNTELEEAFKEVYETFLVGCVDHEHPVFKIAERILTQ